MSEGFVRSAKIGIVVGVAIGLLLIVQWTIGAGIDQTRTDRLNRSLREVAGGDEIFPISATDLNDLSDLRDLRDRGARGETPIAAWGIGNDPTDPNGYIVRIAVAGYRSELDVLYRFDDEFTAVGWRVLSSFESPEIDRALLRRDLDALSGATITRRALESGEVRARRRLLAQTSETQ